MRHDRVRRPAGARLAVSQLAGSQLAGSQLAGSPLVGSLLAGALLTGALLATGACRRPQRTFQPIDAYLGGVTVEQMRQVRYCPAGCEEHVPVDPAHWPALIDGLESATARSEPLADFADWAWICGVTFEATDGRFFSLSVQTATHDLGPQTLITVAGGSVGPDYSLFDGDETAAWCRDVERDGPADGGG